jgi:hypothetical protein
MARFGGSSLELQMSRAEAVGKRIRRNLTAARVFLRSFLTGKGIIDGHIHLTAQFVKFSRLQQSIGL